MPLKSNTPIETWIKDFEDSDNPKFNGKSKEKRQQQAIAAFYAAKKEVKESLDFLLERASVAPIHHVKVIHTGQNGPEQYTDYVQAKSREEAEDIADRNARTNGKKDPIVVRKPSEYKARKEYQVDFSHEKHGFLTGTKRVNDSISLHANSKEHAKSKFEELAAEGRLKNHKIRQIFRKS